MMEYCTRRLLFPHDISADANLVNVLHTKTGAGREGVLLNNSWGGDRWSKSHRRAADGQEEDWDQLRTESVRCKQGGCMRHWTGDRWIQIPIQLNKNTGTLSQFLSPLPSML